MRASADLTPGVTFGPVAATSVNAATERGEGMAGWSWYVNRTPPVVEASGDNKLEDLIKRLVQLLPVEVVSLFTAGDAFARTAPGQSLQIATAAIAIIGLVLV